ncbi:MAG: hypothetical protein CBC29_06055 [Methylococcaceae bacterium TMED69]|nr:MAG: hypothetical protein CBC29_06055 [Methylococcaceae bacterium TMED69]
MAEYKFRKLFQLSGAGEFTDPESYESMWAYSIRYPGTDHSTPGRYRIRITRMSAKDFIILMGGDPTDADPQGYSIQGLLEKWTNNGWIHCLDWMGNPTSSNEEIESDLNEMFQAFTTGLPTDKNWEIPPRPPPRPKRKDAKDKKVPTFEVIEGDKTEKPTKKDGDDPSFDWI